MAQRGSPDNSGEEPRAVEARPSQVPTVRSEELLRGGRELFIVHNSEVYRLLVTRNNKLILQK
jgi:hemin uptake protein HemP